jgi:poly [ADP-ribose] polymerase
MFGKGVYFADMYEKSANYSYNSYNTQDSSLMLLCEVALGKSKEVMQSEYIEELEP